MYDFIVVGGGIAGVSAAAHLSELGSTLVLEAEDALAYHASGRSAALFEENYGKPSTVALNAASYTFHRSAQVLSPRGLMLIGTTKTTEQFERDKREMKLSDMELADALEMIPLLDRRSVSCVAFDPDAWDIDTDRLVQAFARRTRQNGADIKTSAQVQQINAIDGGWQVHCGPAAYEARTIVNAAGAWVDQIAQLAGVAPIGITPLRRSMARVAAPEGHDVSRWPMMFGPGEGWYAKPDAGALIISPAEEDPTEPHDAFTDDLTLAMGIARYEAHVTVPVKRLISSWAGLRSFAPDRSLVLGRAPDQPSFIWCAGQGGYGMQSSPAAGQLLADLVAGRPSTLDSATIAAVSPARFR